MVQHIKVGENDEGQRIDNFCIKQFKNVPKTRLYKAIRKGEVRVNSKRVTSLYRLKTGDQVRLPPLKSTEPQVVSIPEEASKRLKENILYEDDHLVMINKLAGLPVHAGSGFDYGVIDVLKTLYPEDAFLTLAHRIDRLTSGCLMVAKSRQALLQIQELIKTRKIQKTYTLLVEKPWQHPNPYVVDKPLLVEIKPSGHRSIKVHPDGKASVTTFSCVEQFGGFTLLEAKPTTGRMHQIRVHAASIGHPIDGDDRYNARRKKSQRPLFLHAKRLEFFAPWAKKKLCIEASLPGRFQKILDELRERDQRQAD